MTPERFKKNPVDYQVPKVDAVAEKLGSDPNFSAQLEVLIEEYRKAASAIIFDNFD